MIKMHLAAIALFEICLWHCVTTSAAESNSILLSKISTQSAGQRIGIDKYVPPHNEKTPAVLVLHGAGGTLLDGPEMRRVARSLAEAGNTVYLVHYFNRTGTIFGFDAAMQKNFPAWLETVRDCIKFVQIEHGNSSHVGLYGYSLGAFLALAAASDNPAVGAVVEHAGGIWNGKTERIHRMPPVLIVHGKEDQRVPFQKYAAPLTGVLRARGVTFKTRFFPHEGHAFTTSAMGQVRDAAVEFFRRRLVTN